MNPALTLGLALLASTADLASATRHSVLVQESDGTHGATLERFVGADGRQRAFVVTEVSGARLLFRHQPSSADGGASGDSRLLLVDGGLGKLQERWFLTALDEGPAPTPATPAGWFSERLPDEWSQLDYEPGSINVTRVSRNGYDGGVELSFTYEPFPDESPIQVKSAARVWGLQRLHTVKASSAAGLITGTTFAYAAATHALLRAQQGLDGGAPAELAYEYHYAPPIGSGLSAVESSNEIDTVRTFLAPPDAGALVLQAVQKYERGSTSSAPLAQLPHVPASEVVTGFTLPGQQGKPHTLGFPSASGRVFSAASGVTTSYTLADYGAAASITTASASSVGAGTGWTSQQGTTAPVTPAEFTNSTQVGHRTLFDARLRPASESLTPNYSHADPSLGTLVAGATHTATPTSERFAHAGTTTVTAAAGTFTETTQINPSTGEVQSQTVQGPDDTFTLFTNPTYNAQHRLQQWTDEQGRVVTVTKFDDVFGLPQRLTLTLASAEATALGELHRELGYDAKGRLTHTLDVETGAETITTLDALGRVTSSRSMGSGTQSPTEETLFDYALSANAQTVTVRSPSVNSQSSTTTLDGLTTRRSWKFGNGQTATEDFTYDAGRLVSRLDARGVLREFDYDATGRLLAEYARAADAGVAARLLARRLVRDEDGNVLAEVDSLGASVSTSRNKAGRASGSVADAGTGGAPFSKSVTDLPGFPTRTIEGTKEYAVIVNPLGAPASVTFTNTATGAVELQASQRYDNAGRLVSRAEAVSGVTESFEYKDVLGRQTKYVRSYPSPSGVMSLTETRAYEDDGAARTTRVDISRTFTAPPGAPTSAARAESLLSSARGLLLERTEFVTQASGAPVPALTRFFYDAQGRLLRSELPGGGVRTTVYDEAGAVLSTTDEGGGLTSFTQDALGLDSHVVGPRGLELETKHDALGRLLEKREVDAVWTYAYPGGGWVEETAPEPLAHPAQRIHKKRYDGRGQVVESVEPAGGTERRTLFTLDGAAPTKAVTTDGPSWTLTLEQKWDGQGRPTEESEAWHSGAFSYDYLTTTTWPQAAPRTAQSTSVWKENGALVGSPTEAASYDGLGQLAIRTVGAVTDTWARDGLGRLGVFDSADEAPRGFRYGSDGRLASESFGLAPLTPEVTTYGYTPRGDVSSVDTPDGRRSTSEYEYQGGSTRFRALLTKQTVGRVGGLSTSRDMAYDELGRLGSVTEGTGLPTAFDYGPRGNLRKVTQPGGAVWEYHHDKLLRLTEVLPPLGAAQVKQSFEYEDGLGRLTRYELGIRVWGTQYGGGHGVTSTPRTEGIDSLIDGRGRVAFVQYTVAASNGAGLTSKSFGYDGWNALVALRDTYQGAPPATSLWSYDASHRLESVTRGLASTVSYTYDAGTRRRASRGSVGWRYDGFGRLESLTGPWGATPVAWEAGGQRLTALGEETFRHDDRGWLDAVTTPAGARTYGYDGRGNRTSESFGGATRRFGYDGADRLVAVQEWDGHLEAWKLKADGAKGEEKRWPAGTSWPVSFDTTPGQSVYRQFNYAAADGALEAIVEASGADFLRYVLDANGQVARRTTGGRAVDFSWDVDGRLVKATQVVAPGLSSFEVTYGYDGLGLRRRAAQVVTPAVGPAVATQRQWSWAGEDGEEEVAEDGNVTASVGPYRVGEGVQRFGHDALGSVVSQSDGLSTSFVDFSSWGAPTPSPANLGPLVSSAGYAGGRVEAAAGLNYNRMRWEDPLSGTFLSRDPIGAQSYLSNPNGMGPWSYANLSPARFTDPDGRCSGKDSPLTCLGEAWDWAYPPNTDAPLGADDAIPLLSRYARRIPNQFEWTSSSSRMTMAQMRRGYGPNEAVGGLPAYSGWYEQYVAEKARKEALQTRGQVLVAAGTLIALQPEMAPLLTKTLLMSEAGAATVVAATGVAANMSMEKGLANEITVAGTAIALGAEGLLLGKAIMEMQAGRRAAAAGRLIEEEALLAVDRADAARQTGMGLNPEAFANVSRGLENEPLHLAAGPLGPRAPQNLIYTENIVDMELARGLRGSTLNEAGQVRNQQYFWEELIDRRPEMFSQLNVDLIQRGLAPKVDFQWAAFNPEHRMYAWDTLHHHHIDHGPFAAPFPGRAHEIYTAPLHPARR